MCARRLVTVSAPCTRLICWGTKRVPLPQASHCPTSPPQRRQSTLYVMSLRPPLSSGGPHSSVTEVPFTLETRFTGAEGGPGKEAEVWAERGMPKHVGAGRAGSWGKWDGQRRFGSWSACSVIPNGAAKRGKCSKEKTAKTRVGLRVNCRVGPDREARCSGSAEYPAEES